MTPLTPVITAHWDVPDYFTLEGYRRHGGYVVMVEGGRFRWLLNYVGRERFEVASEVLGPGAHALRFERERGERYADYILRENPAALCVRDYGEAVLLVPYFMKRPYDMQLVLRHTARRYLHQLDDGTLREIGPPLGPQSEYEKLGARFHMVTEPVSPWPGINLLAPIPRVTEFEGPAPNLMSEKNGELVPDPFNDDLAMLVKGDEGYTVVTGCAWACRSA